MSTPNKNPSKKGKNKLLTLVVAVLVVALVAGSFVVNSNYFYTGRTAVTVGDTEFTAAEANYFYTTAYNNFMSSMGDYASYIIDTSLPLDEQYYADDLTFHDYFMESAKSSMTWVTALYDAAVASGMTMTADMQAEVDNQISTLEIYASMYSMNVDQYAANVYGKGMDSVILKDLLTRAMLATEYSKSISDSYEYTTEEIEANYAENRDSFDMFDYRVYYIENGEDAEAAYAAADKIATAKDGDEFAELVKAYAESIGSEDFAENEATLYSAAGTTLDSYDYGAWLKEDGRTEFDATSVESSSGEGYYVVMYIGRSANDYNTVDVRHILINVAADESGAYTEEAKATAKAKAEEVLAEFKAGNVTEDSFAELANTYSEDPGSNTTGGLYENVAKGQTVPEFEEFCYAEHEVGDVEIVYSENGSYAGYHIIYYVGLGDKYCDIIADNSLRSAEYTEWENALCAKYETAEFYTARFIG